MVNEDKNFRRGIPAARTNLWVARRCLEKYLAVRAEEDGDLYDELLYYGSFFIFARSALEALRNSDGLLDMSLNETQRRFFDSHIKGTAVFDLLTSERHRIGHGDDALAGHPLKPRRMLERYNEAKSEWFGNTSRQYWPDSPFKGETIEEVMQTVWRQVSSWLDAVDALDEKSRR